MALVRRTHQSFSVLRMPWPGHTNSTLVRPSLVSFQRKYFVCLISPVPTNHALLSDGVVLTQTSEPSCIRFRWRSPVIPRLHEVLRQRECMRTASPPALCPIVDISTKKIEQPTTDPTVSLAITQSSCTPRRCVCVLLRTSHAHAAQRHEHERTPFTTAGACRLSDYIFLHTFEVPLSRSFGIGGLGTSPLLVSSVGTSLPYRQKNDF